MAACVKSTVIDHELAAIRIQEQELQSRHDALLAERLAIAFSLGVDAENEEEIGSIMVQMGLEVCLSDIRQLESQLQELRAVAGNLLAESLHESILEQEEASRLSEEAAKVLMAQERWRAQMAGHDAAFARKLARVDEDTWLKSGDILEEPFGLPMPADVPNADAPGPSGSQQQKGTPHPTERCTAATACGPTITQSPLSLVSSGPGPSGGPGPSIGAPGPSKALCNASASEGRPFQHATGPTRGSVQCLSCFDNCAVHAVTCAGADAPSSSTATAGCKHYFCSGCLTEYMRGMVRDRKFPINCPMAAGGAAGQQGCKLKFSREAVLVALEGHPKEIQVYRTLETESSLDPSQVLYCPHKACSSPMLVNKEELQPNTPAICPACRKKFCPHCRIPGWHKGYTCEAFQALPAHLRSADDAAMLQLSKQKQWKQCPRCKQMVERSEGCNHMLCRCGSNFCYACGEPYKDTKATASNVHGTPACGCPLFDVPADENQDRDEVVGEDQDEDAGVPMARLQADLGLVRVFPPQPRHWRNGRPVSRKRCYHSASIYDCPKGPGKCWFWHDEDYEY
ncbi:hypothetical protein VaNZ11_001357 [Volvox africanus]|uniref:RBR-type E3 ubiquitin transferase n=1 Tax=Volvox africanus TaxID=51714 RepID=A0ABQ5RPU1_9CHLO|nr:hypothetical protein VaNZ11_001357 [Volvox africanus]